MTVQRPRPKNSSKRPPDRPSLRKWLFTGATLVVGVVVVGTQVDVQVGCPWSEVSKQEISPPPESPPRSGVSRGLEAPNVTVNTVNVYAENIDGYITANGASPEPHAPGQFGGNSGTNHVNTDPPPAPNEIPGPATLRPVSTPEGLPEAFPAEARSTVREIAPTDALVHPDDASPRPLAQGLHAPGSGVPPEAASEDHQEGRKIRGEGVAKGGIGAARPARRPARHRDPATATASGNNHRTKSGGPDHTADNSPSSDLKGLADEPVVVTTPYGPLHPPQDGPAFNGDFVQ